MLVRFPRTGTVLHPTEMKVCSFRRDTAASQRQLARVFSFWLFLLLLILWTHDSHCTCALAQDLTPGTAQKAELKNAVGLRAPERAELQKKSVQYWLNGELNNAIQSMTKLIEIESALFGASHPRLSQRYDALANFYIELGDLAQAEQQTELACTSLLSESKDDGWQAVEVARTRSILNTWKSLSQKERQILFDLNREQNQHVQVQRFSEAIVASEQFARLVGEYLGERHPESIDAVLAIETLHLALQRTENVGSQLNKLYGVLEQVEHPDHPNFGKILWLLSILASYEGDSQATVRYAKSAAEQYENANATYDVNYVRALSQYATGLYGLGNIEEAIPVFRKAYQLWTCDLAVEDEQETIISRDLCFLLQQVAHQAAYAHRWDEAEALLHESKLVSEQTWGANDYRSSEIAEQLGLIGQARNWSAQQLSDFDLYVSTQAALREAINEANHPASIEAAQQSYELASRLFGGEAPLTLRTKRDLLALQMQFGRFSPEGQARFVTDLMSFIPKHAEVFGQHHPNHAELCFYAAEYTYGTEPSAIELARTSCEAYRVHFTKASEEYRDASTLLGTLLANDWDEECVAILDETIQLWESSPSRGCYRHCMAARYLGKYYYEQGLGYEARIHLSNAVRLMRDNREIEIQDLANTLNDLANVYSDREDYEDALIYYQEAISLYRENTAIKQDVASTNWLLYNTARTCYHLKKYYEAEQLLVELLERFPTTSYSSDDAFLSGCYYLARVQLKLNKLDQAQQTLQRATEAIRIHYSDSPLVYAEMLLESAEFHSMQNQVQAASEMLDLAFATLRDKANPTEMSDGDASEFFRLSDRLIVDYEDLGLWEQSEAARAHAAPLVEQHFSEQWEWIVTFERRQLEEAKLMATATQEQRKQIDELRSRTKYLNEHVKEGFANVESTDTNRLVSAFETCIQVLGDYNLIAAEYRKVVADYFESRQAYQNALFSQQYVAQTYSTLLGETHPYASQAFANAARVGRRVGLYQQSKAMLDIAIRNLISVQGELNEDTLAAALEMSQLLVDVKDYASCLPVARATEQSIGTALGRNSLQYAEILGVLGQVYQGMNELDVAIDYFARSHQVYADRLEPNDRRRLKSAGRNAIAQAWKAPQSQSALREIENVLAGYRESKQTKLTDYVELSVEYGDALLRMDRFEAAIVVFEEASQSVIELDGFADDIQRAAIAYRLGITHRKLGNLEEARVRLANAAEVQRRIYGDQSQQLCDTLFEQAIVSRLSGDNVHALAMVIESLKIEENLLGNVGYLLSDQSLSSILATDENRLSLLLTCLLNDQQIEKPSELGFQWALNRKGLALDLSCRLRNLQQSRVYDSKVVRLSSRVRLLNQELADLALLSSSQQSLAEIRKKQSEIAQEIATTNGELSIALKSAKVKWNDSTDDNPNAVRQSLPPGAVFIEYIRVEGIADTSKEIKSDRYAAFVVQAGVNGSLQLKDLGEASEVDELINSLRTETRDFAGALKISTEAALEEAYREVSHSLYEKLLGPLRDELANCKTLVIGPDASISVVPFAALVDDEGKYLVETMDISYVSSSRDLLRQNANVGKGTLIVASPNFDADLSSRKEIVEEISQQSVTRSSFATRGMDIETRALRWRKLPGAESEANEVADLLMASDFAPVRKYLGNEAVEEVLKVARSPRILHIATHGFYVPQQDELRLENDDARSASFVSGLARLRSDSNPLLRSGIVLAGANRVAQQTDESIKLEDGWVTAQEIAAMDFRNTELIVLSACESGLGDLTNGQGLQGIRRAFTNAGAHAVLTSLFEVPDVETRDLMRAFYQNYSTSQKRVHAINEAQRQQIAARRTENQAAHPFYWASFIMLSNVDGAMPND